MDTFCKGPLARRNSVSGAITSFFICSGTGRRNATRVAAGPDQAGGDVATSAPCEHGARQSSPALRSSRHR